jgi:hypothetical protein
MTLISEIELSARRDLMEMASEPASKQAASPPIERQCVSLAPGRDHHNEEPGQSVSPPAVTAEAP